jgi:hypothetical protein
MATQDPQKKKKTSAGAASALMFIFKDLVKTADMIPPTKVTRSKTRREMIRHKGVKRNRLIPTVVCEREV